MSAIAIEPAALAVPRALPVKRLSVSSMSLFERCPERWRKKYLEREPEPQTLKMSAGKAFGAALAAHYAARIDGRELSHQESDDRLLAEFDLLLSETEVSEGEDPNAFRESCREPLRSYLAAIAPGIRPLAVERRVEARFPGAEWSFVGYLDLETEDGLVVDYKLSERHVTDERARSDPQPSAYLLVRALEGVPAGGFEFHSGRRGPIRTGERWLRVPAERDDARLARFQARVALVARAIARAEESGDWTLGTQGWWCGPSCPHYEACPGGAG